MNTMTQIYISESRTVRANRFARILHFSHTFMNHAPSKDCHRHLKSPNPRQYFAHANFLSHGHLNT